jgi:hypothetical protein
MKEARIHNNQALITDNQSAEISQPGEGPLDFPVMLVALFDFGRRSFTSPVSPVRDQKANTSTSQAGPQFVRNMRLSANEPFGPGLGAATTLAGHFDGPQSFFCRPHFRRRCRSNVPPRGISCPSTTTIHFDPCPAWFSRLRSPFFSLERSWRL